MQLPPTGEILVLAAMAGAALMIPSSAQAQAGAQEARACDGGSVPAEWARIRGALRSASAAVEAGKFEYRTVVYEKRLEAGTLAVLEEAGELLLLDAPGTFVAPDPEEVAVTGFVWDSAGSVFFHVPQPSTLLSDAFLDTHCFRGLSFEPESEWDVTEVAGRFEVDGSGGLRAVEYAYVNLPWDVAEGMLGGRLELDRLPAGDWVITRSWIRTPYLEVGPAGARVTAVRESGSHVVEVLDSAGAPTRFVRPGSLAGVVYDSTAGGVLAGAEVVLLGTDYRARADADGRFRIPAIAPGEYLVWFEHPRRDAVGYRPRPLAIRVAPGLVQPLDLAIPAEIPPPWTGPLPGGAGLETREGRELSAEEGSWLTAQVLDASSTLPIEGMEVRFQGLRAVTDSAGWFRLRRLRPGEHVIEFDHIGYGQGHAPITLPERRETIAQFRMPAKALDVGEIVARERSREAEVRRMSPVGTQVMDEADLEEVGLRTGLVGDALRTMTGVNVFYGRFYGPGHESQQLDIVCIEGSRPFPTLSASGPSPWCNMVEVYIDDLSIPAAGEFLRNIPLTDFERIEYVPALGATRWGLRASETGVLLLYTKR